MADSRQGIVRNTNSLEADAVPGGRCLSDDLAGTGTAEENRVPMPIVVFTVAVMAAPPARVVVLVRSVVAGGFGASASRRPFRYRRSHGASDPPGAGL